MSQEKRQNRTNYWLLYGIGFVAVVMGFVLRQPITEMIFPPEIPPKPPIVKPYTPPDISPYLNDAKSRSDAAIEQSLQDIRDFFTDAKKNSRSFAETAMSFGSKWRLIADYVPPATNFANRWLMPDVPLPLKWAIKKYVPPIRGKQNEQFLKREFEAKIFSSDQLIKAIGQAVANYERRVANIENNMLTKMKNELPDLPESASLKTLETSQLFNAYQKAIEKISAEGQTIVREATAAEVGGMIAGEILTSIAIRLGISSGILGAGAASGVYTLGIGVVVGIIVDYIVSWVWDWYADPKGELAKKIEEQLDVICRLIIDGAEEQPEQPAVIGLRSKLLEYSNNRSKLRKEAVTELLTP